MKAEQAFMQHTINQLKNGQRKVTAYEEDKKDAFAAGMNGHIAKPIDIHKLLHVVSEVLK